MINPKNNDTVLVRVSGSKDFLFGKYHARLKRWDIDGSTGDWDVAEWWGLPSAGIWAPAAELAQKTTKELKRRAGLIGQELLSRSPIPADVVCTPHEEGGTFLFGGQSFYGVSLNGTRSAKGGLQRISFNVPKFAHTELHRFTDGGPLPFSCVGDVHSDRAFISALRQEPSPEGLVYYVEFTMPSASKAIPSCRHCKGTGVNRGEGFAMCESCGGSGKRE